MTSDDGVRRDRRHGHPLRCGIGRCVGGTRALYPLLVSIAFFQFAVVVFTALSQPRDDASAVPATGRRQRTPSLQSSGTLSLPQHDNPLPSFHTQPSATPNKNRVFVGILSGTASLDVQHRTRIRKLFSLWKHNPALCSLRQFLAAHPPTGDSPNASSHPCQVVYSFIFASNETYADTTMQLTLPSPPYNQQSLNQQRQRLTVPPDTLRHIPDLRQNPNDYIVLRIIDNMDRGKSQTFLSYAVSVVLQQHPSIGYVMKIDLDSMIRLHALLHVLDHQLPLPHPHRDVATLAGSLRNKAIWVRSYRNESSVVDIKERYWIKQYGSLHLYLAGQCYILSRDMAHAAVQEAIRLHRNNALRGKDNVTYLEGPEDHDISALAVHGSSRSIRWVVLGKHTRFWEHPVKGNARWQRIWKREEKRQREKHQLLHQHMSSDRTSDGNRDTTVVQAESPTPPTILVTIVVPTTGALDGHRSRLRQESSAGVCPANIRPRSASVACPFEYIFLLHGHDEAGSNLTAQTRVAGITVPSNDVIRTNATIAGALPDHAVRWFLRSHASILSKYDYVAVIVRETVDFPRLIQLRDQHLIWKTAAQQYPSVMMGSAKEMLVEQAKALNATLSDTTLDLPIHPFFREHYNSVHLYLDTSFNYLLSVRLTQSIMRHQDQSVDNNSNGSDVEEIDISTAVQMIPKVFPHFIILRDDDVF